MLDQQTYELAAEPVALPFVGHCDRQRLSHTGAGWKGSNARWLLITVRRSGVGGFWPVRASLAPEEDA